MGLFQPAAVIGNEHAMPPCAVRYSAVFWEPLPGTNERVVALVAIEPHESTQLVVTPGTHIVLSAARLRALLGREGGKSALGVLTKAAEFMTSRQQAGLPLAELRAPFNGFATGPVMIGRGFAVDQLLDAAVRSVSAFGNALSMIEDEEQRVTPRHTLGTGDFLTQVKRAMSLADASTIDRFEQRLDLPDGAPEIEIDYAFEKWLVQVTSLPSTERQATNAHREAQSKLLELELARRHAEHRVICPALMVNEDALSSPLTDKARDEALKTRERLAQLAQSFDTTLISVPTVDAAAAALAQLPFRHALACLGSSHQSGQLRLS